MSRRTRIALAAAVAALSLAVAVAPAMAGKTGPNNENAKKCQGEGYKSLFTSTGDKFANADACTSYAAMGGTLLTSPPLTAYQQACAVLTNFVNSTPLPNQFRCQASGSFLGDFDANRAALLGASDSLLSACQALGGTVSGGGFTNIDQWSFDATCTVP